VGENLVNARGIKVRRDTDQTGLVTATPTAVIFSHRVDFFVNNVADWSSSVNPSRVAISAPGVYLCVANVSWVNAATGNRQAYIRKNGTTGVYGFDSRLTQATGVTTNTVTVVLSLKVGEYLELMALQDAGANRDIDAVTADETPSLSVFCLHRYYDASLGQEV